MQTAIRASFLCATLLCGGIGQATTTTFNSVDIGPQANTRLQDPPFLGQREQYPVGDVVFAGVPFHIQEVGSNAWTGRYAEDGNLEGIRVLELDVNVFGATTVHTLLNTFGGEDLPGTFASVQFFGSDLAFHEVFLDGNSDVRDYFFGEFTNTINNTTTREVFSAGSGIYDEVRLDMQTIDLPEEFQSQELVRMRFVDTGGTNPNVVYQRLILSGVTVAAVPEPASYLLAIGMACLACLRVRTNR